MTESAGSVVGKRVEEQSGRRSGCYRRGRFGTIDAGVLLVAVGAVTGCVTSGKPAYALTWRVVSTMSGVEIGHNFSSGTNLR